MVNGIVKKNVNDPWACDTLGYRSLGATFTNLIKSVNEAKVISIEAGFGWGKTFFRKAWAQHLRDYGEVAIEIDAQQSDHSGDAVVTFLGALMAALPEKEQSKFLNAWSTGKKLAWGDMKIGATVLARKAGEEAVESLDNMLSKDGETSKIDEILTSFGENVSHALSTQVAAQLSAEQVRSREMPQQLAELRQTLTQDTGTDRVVILIDELERCHPDYAIALLEAMKLAFNEDGYVFVLFVNREYLENLAEHRFGAFGSEGGEGYLDKFIDLRLKLAPKPEAKAEAARQIVLQYPEFEPYGDDPEFGLERAGQVAFDAVQACGPTMRQIKRTLERVELVIRCHRGEPMDVPLLVCLAFNETNLGGLVLKRVLSRASLTAVAGAELVKKMNEASLAAAGQSGWERERRLENEFRHKVHEEYPELIALPSERFDLPDDQNYHPWWRVVAFLAPHYLPMYEAMLNAAHHLQTGTDEANDDSENA